MPECPEVKTIKEDLEKVLLNNSISNIITNNTRNWIFSNNIPVFLNKEISSIDRIGKYLILSFKETTNKLQIHLSFTGNFSLSENNFTCATFVLRNNQKLYFSDKRGMAKFTVLSEESYTTNTTLNDHKIDGLDSSLEEIEKLLTTSKSNKEIKPYLMNYKNICGIGNTYASEILFNAKINPRERLSNLTLEQKIKLSNSIKFVLQRAYNSRGSSIEHKNIFEPLGTADQYFKVYLKQVCPECGKKIFKIKQESRTTYYCNNCQKGNTI